MEMHGGHLVKLWVLLIEVQALRLANIGASGNGQVHHAFLFDLPDGLIDFAKIFRNLRDLLHTTVIGDNLVLDLGRPQANLQ